MVLKVPGQRNGFGYYDSQMERSGARQIEVITGKSFIEPGFAVHSTLKQINDQRLQRVAWSDQPPNGDASASYAHSKALIAFNPLTAKGFQIDHSLPRFPEFDSAHNVKLVNNPNSNTYGQHVFCMSLSMEEMERIAQNTIFIRPYVYEMGIQNGPAQLRLAPNLLKLQNTKATTPDVFRYANFTAGSTNVRGIFKTSGKKTSIFGDSGVGGGLIAMLQSPLLVETWRGDDGSYCPRHDTVERHLSHQSLPGFYSVEYISKVQLNPSISWVRTQDHSKWAVAKNVPWTCFGGMNRQKSQWLRGGQFFCLESAILNQVMKSIIGTHENCS